MKGGKAAMPRGRPAGTGTGAGTRKPTGSKQTVKTIRSAAEVLTEANSSPVMLAPAVKPEEVTVHRQLLLLEFTSPALLEEVLSATVLANFVVRRLGETALMVDHQRQDELVKLLTKKGYEPKITRV
ncbi:MAG: hypothetical protein J0I20_32985 [Chloroflexi bacterium]|nr:hypothetical protein [Chloroflexota bacterium]